MNASVLLEDGDNQLVLPVLAYEESAATYQLIMTFWQSAAQMIEASRLLCQLHFDYPPQS